MVMTMMILKGIELGEDEEEYASADYNVENEADDGNGQDDNDNDEGDVDDDDNGDDFDDDHNEDDDDDEVANSNYIGGSCDLSYYTY